MKKKEIWKDIEGFDGIFKVSTRGRVKRVGRNVTDGRGSYFMKGNILKANNPNSHGYITAVLTIAGVQSTKNVHRLVAEAFISNPDCLETVNHIDGVKHNNILSNLEWSSRSDNQKHAYKLGLQKPTKYWTGKFGKDHVQSRPVYQICPNTDEVINRFDSIIEASKKTNACRSKIPMVCRGKRKTTGSFKWRYADE